MDRSSAPRGTCDVLLVEDNLADANLLLWCLADARTEFKIHVARDSEAAFEHLRAHGNPDLVLLDLNLPGRDGREILDDIRSDPRWSALPVVILTSSQAQADIRTCTEKRASRYLTKPLNLAGYEEIARAIEGYWLSLAEPGAPETPGTAAGG